MESCKYPFDTSYILDLYSSEEEYLSTTILLISKKNLNSHFLLTRKQCFISSLIKTSQSDISCNVYENSVINVDVEPKILEMIVEYMTYRNGDDSINISLPVRDKLEKFILNKGDITFIKKVGDKKMLFDLLNAADYFGIDSLLHLTSAMLAYSIRGKTKENIFRIVDKREY